MKVSFRRVDWEFITPFRISYRVRTHAQTVVLELLEGDCKGRGEALGVSYHGETADTLMDQLRDVASDLRNGVSREGLQQLLPPGGARNAVDCALWDLEAKRAGRRVWNLIGLEGTRPLQTAYTLGLDTPESTARAAASKKQCSLLKIKLSGSEDLERVACVRKARPDAQLIVDANQSWSQDQLVELSPLLARMNVRLIEQPLARDRDDFLAQFTSPVPLCADESCQTAESVQGLVGKYQYVNIKLDKTGGLTEALRVLSQVRQCGLRAMIGCMGGSSLSMAPAFIAGQYCDVVDLDAPLLMKADVDDAIVYDGDRMDAPRAELWG